MTSDEKEKLSDIINDQIRNLIAEIQELQELTKPIPLDSSIGRISRMDAINNKTINDAALRDKKKLLTRLERTLDRLHETDFGICQKCGNPIPFGRLQIIPHTTRCTQCMGR